MLMSIQIICK